MSTPAHTGDPWFLSDDGLSILTGDPKDPLIVARFADDSDVLFVGNCPDGSEDGQPQANAARVLACVNSLAGLNPEAVAECIGTIDEATETLEGNPSLEMIEAVRATMFLALERLKPTK